MTYPKITFLACDYPAAQTAFDSFSKTYGNVPLTDCDIVVALGGDGFMLHVLHSAYYHQKPVFGLNFGQVGFLMNLYSPDYLLERLQGVHTVEINPLKVIIEDVSGQQSTRMAFNEVSLLRQLHQASKMKINVDDSCVMEELVGDGIIISTPVGSTAYNLSANGPILPLTSNLLALTPISPFRPRRWRGALLPNTVTIHIENSDPCGRPVSVSADYQEVRNIKQIWIHHIHDQPVKLLFDYSHKLDDRIIKEQFII